MTGKSAISRDLRAAISTLLVNCDRLRQQLQIAIAYVSGGFTRGWRPDGERQDLTPAQTVRGGEQEPYRILFKALCLRSVDVSLGAGSQFSAH